MKGQALYLAALGVYLVSLPLLVKHIAGNSAATGVARTVHYWVFGAASLGAGDVVSRIPFRRVLSAASLARAALFGSIGVLALAGALPMPLLLALIGVNAIAVAHQNLVGMGAAGAGAVFGDPERKKSALYLYNGIKYASYLAVPLVWGPAIDRLDARFGAGSGAAAGFLLFAGLMLRARSFFERVSVASATTLATRSSRPSPTRSATSAARRFLRETPARLAAAAAVIVNNRMILARAAISLPSEFLEDALFSVALPTLAIETLSAGATGTALLYAAMNLGGMLAAACLGATARTEARVGLFPFLQLLSAAAALSFLPSIGLWSATSLWAACPLVLAMKVLHEPANLRMQELLQTAIASDPAARKVENDVYGLLGALETAAAGLGGLAFGWLFLHSGTGSGAFAVLGAGAPMKVVTLCLGTVSAATLLALPWLRRQLYRRYESPPGYRERTISQLEPNLARLGYPRLERVMIGAPPERDRPAVALLAPPSAYKLSVAREGGRQAPGDVHLVLDPSWLTQELRPDGTTRLWLTRGIAFNRGGRPRLTSYARPRSVGYFANFFTKGANERDDGLPLERGLDAPMSSSARLERIVNEKFHTRRLLSAKGLAVPASFAFLMAAHPQASAARALDRDGARPSSARLPSRDADVRRSLSDFLASAGATEVVVKPSGPDAHSARGVAFFPRRGVDGIVEHVRRLASGLAAHDGSILVDERIEPPPLYFRREQDGGGRFAVDAGGKSPLHLLTPAEIRRLPRDRPPERKDWNLRVLVSRTPQGGAETSMILARAGTWGVPTSVEPEDPSDAAAFLRLEDVVDALQLQHGLLPTRAAADAFRREIESVGRRALEAIMEDEGDRSISIETAPRQAQTDMIGLDVMIALRGNRLVPVVIEVNDHDAGGQWQFDVLHPDRAGQHSRAWIATMLARARRDASSASRRQR